MKINQIELEQKIVSNRDFCGVPKGTEGYIIEIDMANNNITIAWDLEDNPYPKHLSPDEIAKMWAIEDKCPLRDGFRVPDELKFLDVIE